MPAQERTTRRSVTGTPQVPMRRTRAARRRGRFRHPPHLDDRRPRGVFVDRDLRRAVAGRSVAEPPAGEGRPPAVTAARAADPLRVAQALAEHDTSLLLLFTERRPAGGGDDPVRPLLRLVLRPGTIDARPVEAAQVSAGLDV